ncbi:transposon Ty3-G Gag-Pol polyprotein [Trichonephila clavipes]|nr:transposon Ty3-G Gag-Pol polyprotein [Trichonephila clavipes]
MLSRPVTQEEESFCEANNITIADMPTRSCVLYRYVPDVDSAEAQLVIPNAERELIMQRHHNDPMAGHYGEDGTFQKIAKQYYWTGMKKYISDYIKKCPECARFKATNQKHAGLLRTPVYSQRFEVIAIDLFGPLPQTDSVERKNRDLKPRLAILVGEDHSNWHSKLPVIRFAMNTTVCDTTGHTPAYLLFGRELRTIEDVVQYFKSVIHNDSFVAEITYLK